MIKIEHNKEDEKGRFVMYENDVEAGELIFSMIKPNKMSLDHTEVQKEFGGKGYAHQLVMESVRYARENDFKVIPVCNYAKKVFTKDETIQDVME